MAASPRSGVNTVTGEGLAEALTSAQVVVDVSNAPSWEDAAVMKFFDTSTRNLLAAEAKAGVRHHVALSVVGTDRLQESGYFRAKLVQEKLIAASDIPYTIVHATQFFEFLGGIAQGSTDGQVVRLPSALMQPMAADDVAAALADYTLEPPLNRIVEIAGPEAGAGIDEAVRRYLTATGDAAASDHRRQSALLRRQGERKIAHARQRRSARPHPPGRLAWPPHARRRRHCLSCNS